VKVDVACVGAPFLDLIFRGLPALPGPGEEQLAAELVIVPGAMANVAYALERLGLGAVVCSPVGRDPAGRLLGELMADAGVRWFGQDADATPVSVALPANGDRAFVTVSPPTVVDLETLAGLDARAIVVDLPNVPLLPPHRTVYAVVGDPEARALVGHLPRSLASVRAFILNEREARAIMQTADADEAAIRLASLGTTVVVTRGPSGASATDQDGRTVRVEAPVVAVADPTGAGDLFTGAYVWADLGGRPLEQRLALATAYASFSLERASNRQKGMALDEFRLALMEQGRTDYPWVEEG
jgi:sugar/nucleoside kinase (ribokinase family)